MAGLNSYDFKSYQPVLVNENGLESPRSFAIDATKVTSFSGADGKTQKIIYPGVFAADAGSGKIRPIPRSLTGAALVASTTTSFTVSANTARHFIAGEALSVIAPYAVFTFANTWAANDTANAVIDGVTVTTTAAGADLAVEAAAMATAINANIFLKSKVAAIADGTSKVYVYAKDFASFYTTTASETTAGDGTFAAGAAAMSGNVSIGTIDSVAVATDTITLTAASSISLPVGFPIGVASVLPYDSNGEPFGLLSPNNELDLEYSPDENIHGVFVGANVYRDRLVYVDGQLEALLPEIHFV